MRHLRPFPVLVAVAMMGAACSSSSPAASSGGSPTQAAEQSQASSPSQGGTASQPAASAGGGGGGGGANGSMTYEITGDYQASGELPYVTLSSWIEQAGGWVAYFQTNDTNSAVIQINTQAAAGTSGQSWTFGDGKVLVVATSDPGSGTGCTFTLTKNDASGTEGQLACTSAPMTRLDTGASGRVKVSARWSGHP